MKKLLTLMLVIACTAIAQAEALGIKLEAFKVVAATSERAEQFLPAEEASPEEVIEYRAVYTNTSDATLRNIAPEIPIPAGLAALQDSDLPKATAASVNGQAFTSLPLIGADGKPVPYAAFKAFRWNIAELAPGQSVTFRIRASVLR